MTRRLDRTFPGVRQAAPPRIAHLGLGAFHRAHQAWFTARTDDAQAWGIAAFSGRSAGIVDDLHAQGGVYTLVERGPQGDRLEMVDSLSSVDRGDGPAFANCVADPRTAIVTLTVTERAYLLGEAGLDHEHPDVQSDVRALGIGHATSTVIGRLTEALAARRRAHGEPLAVLPCDNLPDAAGRVRAAVLDLASRVAGDLATWISTDISFVATSVDRITPRTTAADIAAVRHEIGRVDTVPVVTEPFADWVVSGEFPAGRPAWEGAGVRFVDDIRLWERRKLWLLNGAHTLLASLGLLRGHATVAEAIADAECERAVRLLWSVAAAHLPGADVGSYTDALLARFRNARIEHRLAQIAQDAELKARLRLVPVLEAERSAGRVAPGATNAIAACVAFGVTEHREPADGVLARIAPTLAADEPVAVAVGVEVRRLLGNGRNERDGDPR